MTDPYSFLGQAFGWVSLAALVAFISMIASNIWERKKLARSERIKSYSAFRSAVSRWSKEIGAMGAIMKSPDFSEEDEKFQRVKDRVMEARDLTYDAYTQIEMVAPSSVVGAAYSILTLNDAQYRTFFRGGKGVPADKKAVALAHFTAVARKDLGLKEIDSEKLKKDHKYRAIEG